MNWDKIEGENTVKDSFLILTGVLLLIEVPIMFIICALFGLLDRITYEPIPAIICCSIWLFLAMAVSGILCWLSSRGKRDELPDK